MEVLPIEWECEGSRLLDSVYVPHHSPHPEGFHKFGNGSKKCKKSDFVLRF